MKKYKIIAYITLIIIVLLCGFFVYKVFAKNDAGNEKLKEKSLSEIKYIDSKFISLFNQMNNIKFENYKISSTEAKTQKSSNEQSEGNSQSEGSEEKSSKQESQSNGQSKENNGVENANADSNNKIYNLEEKRVLTNDENINWKEVKNDVESMYTQLYTMTLDLYQTSINQEDIIGFNKEYDNLTKIVKEENKESTLQELSKLYNYLPKFVEGCSDKEKEKTIIKTKNNIFKAYSNLDKENWAEISNNINSASQDFTKLITEVDTKENKNQYTKNKIYVMINELQNAVQLKDRDIFLIKYKNILEEIQNL